MATEFSRILALKLSEKSLDRDLKGILEAYYEQDMVLLPRFGGLLEPQFETIVG